jgi:hypothetical protein
MSKFLILFLTMIGASLCTTAYGAPVATKDQAEDLKLEASIESITDATLRFTLTNTSTQPMSFGKPYLPWGNVNSIVIVVVKKTLGNPTLAGMRPFDNPIDEEVLIAPGQSISGTVRVSDYVEKIDQELRKGELLVLWSYQPKTRDGVIFKRRTGHFELNTK